MSEAAAIVLAGGRGTRLGLEGVPKPMAPVCGRPFLDWVLRYLAGNGVARARISTGHLGDVVERRFPRACLREPEPLGTGGAFVWAARQSGLEPGVWLLCNGDSLLLVGLAALFDALGDADAAILGRLCSDASRYGSLDVGEDGFLRRFREKVPGRGLVNAGVYLFRPRTLDLFPDSRPLSLEREAIPALLGRGRKIAVAVAEGPFLDIGTPADLARAGEFISGHRSWFETGVESMA